MTIYETLYCGIDGWLTDHVNTMTDCKSLNSKRVQHEH